MSCSVMIEVEFGASSGFCAAFDAVATVSSKTSSVLSPFGAAAPGAA
jgi:hypothetical protein